MRSRRKRKTNSRAAQEENKRILAEHVEFILGVAERARRRTIEEIIAVGERLFDAQSRLDHGEWAGWLEKNFGWSDSTALNLMNVYKLVKSAEYESLNFKELSITISELYALARPSTPKEVQAKVIDAAKAGHHIGTGYVKEAQQPTLTSTEANGHEASPVTQEEASQPTTGEVDGQEATSAAADESGRETETEDKPKDWRERDIRGTFVDLVKIALDIKKKYDGLAQEHLDPDVLYQALHAVTDLEKSTATVRKAIGILNIFVGAVESTFGFLPAPPPPMWGDATSDDEATSSGATSNEAAQTDVPSAEAEQDEATSSDASPEEVT